MRMKKIKEESLEFKINREQTEMENKLGYNKGVLAMLRGKIEEAEVKVEKVQAQADVIKTGAQFRKVANLDEMNDACSYKLFTKDKL